MAWTDPQSANVRAARRLCVLGAGAAAIAVPLPWQEWWQSSCISHWSYGGSWLDEPTGPMAAAVAMAVLLLSGLGDTTARQLVRRARMRAWLAVAGAAIWVTPLPFGPGIPVGAHGVIHWSWTHRAGAVGALTCAVGAMWWARALGALLTDRAWRRAVRRRTRLRTARGVRLPAAVMTGARV